MEVFSLDNVLAREYPVSQITWTTDQAQGFLLATINFPKILFDNQFIFDKLKNFRFFRGGVELSIRVAASKFVYGSFQVNYLPDAENFSRPTMFEQIWAGSRSPHVLVSAAASETVIFTVPFISKRRALDLSGYTDAEIGRFNFIVQNPLVDILGQTNSAQVIVTARFVDPNVFMAESSRKARPLKEGYRKSQAGVITSTLESTATLAGIASLIPAVGPVGASISEISRGVARFTRMKGLSKPTTEAVTQVMRINPFSDLASGKGIDLSTKLAMDPENAVSTNPLFGTGAVDDMDFKYILGTPSLVLAKEIHPTATQQYAGAIGPIEDNSPCLADMFVNNFRWWCGSYKFKFYLMASQMHAARIVFWVGLATNDNWQNCYHRVVDVQGDTEFEFVIPYMNRGVVSSVTANQYKLWYTVLSWSQPDDAINAPVYLNVYKACGSDFRVGGLVDMQFQVQSNPRFDFTKDFEPLHPSFTGYTTSGIVLGEEYTTLREVVHRYHAYYTISGASFAVMGQIPPATPVTLYGLERFACFFRYWRGSVRVKLLNRDSDRTYVACVSDYSTPTNFFTGVVAASQINPVLDMDIPYYTNNVMESVYDPAPYNLRVQASLTGKPAYLLKAGGDDISFCWLMGPSPASYTNTSSTSGTPGLIAYMSS